MHELFFTIYLPACLLDPGVVFIRGLLAFHLATRIRSREKIDDSFCSSDIRVA